MFPTMYGMQPNNRANMKSKSRDSFSASNQESYTYSGKQGRFSDYGDYYGSYDDGYGVDKTFKNLGGHSYGAQTYGSYAGYGKQCPGISIALLLITLLGVTLMGYILWSKINAAAGRRKKRYTTGNFVDVWEFVENFLPILLNGNIL